jgi:hypothetical protein
VNFSFQPQNTPSAASRRRARSRAQVQIVGAVDRATFVEEQLDKARRGLLPVVDLTQF